MTVAVEDAAEWLVIVFVLEGARHRRHADVVGQFHVLSAVGVAIVYVVGKVVPLRGIGDDEWILFGSGAIQIGVNRDGETFRTTVTACSCKDERMVAT